VRKLLDQLGGWPRLLIIVSAVLVSVSLQPLIGTDGWAGLGQWVGGLGAFFAAWAALRIAKDEAGRENQREVDRLRTQAYYVVAEITLGSAPQGFHVCVTNEATDPILDLQVVGLRRNVESRGQLMLCNTDGEPPEVLLPGDKWETWLTPKDHAADNDTINTWVNAKVYIKFRDLAQTRWKRTGRQPPIVDESPQS
jgi:hypothetical protein